MKHLLPRNYTIYQFWLVIAAMFASAMVVATYIGHVVALTYRPKEDHRFGFAALIALWFAALAWSLFEAVTLRFYRKHTPLDYHPKEKA
jgi:hypothetical protein